MQKRAVKERIKRVPLPGAVHSGEAEGQPKRRGNAVRTRAKRAHQIDEDLERVQTSPERYSSASFARRIKERAAELGISLRQVAQGAEIDPSFLTRIISGERNAPSDEVLERLALALKMPTLDLFLEAGRIPKLGDGVRRALPAFIDAAGDLSEDQIRTVFATLNFIRASQEKKR